MKFYYDGAKTEELRERLSSKLDKKYGGQRRGDELHVSDITGCPLKPFCRICLGLEPIFTKKHRGLMFFGDISEAFVLSLLPEDERQYETTIENLIEGHLDGYEDKIYPWEIKGSRKRIFKKEQVPEEWVERLAIYLSMEGKPKGWIILLNIFSTDIFAFCLEMTSSERMAQLIVAIERAEKIVEACNKRDPSLLEPHSDECDSCGYKPRLKKGYKGCPRYVRKKKKKKQ